MVDTPEAPDEVTPELAAARKAKLQEMNAAGGGRLEDHPQADYFGLTETKNITLPDGVSFFTIKTLTEGDRRQYLKATNRAVKLDRSTRVAELQMAGGEERIELLKLAIVGWNLQRGGSPLPYGKGVVVATLEAMPPAILETVEKAVFDMNTWLRGEVTIKDIDDTIEELQQQRAELVKQEEGKASS